MSPPPACAAPVSNLAFMRLALVAEAAFWLGASLPLAPWPLAVPLAGAFFAAFRCLLKFVLLRKISPGKSAPLAALLSARHSLRLIAAQAQAAFGLAPRPPAGKPGAPACIVAAGFLAPAQTMHALGLALHAELGCQCLFMCPLGPCETWEEYALRIASAIRAAAAGPEKVLFVGHSMGARAGLAALAGLAPQLGPKILPPLLVAPALAGTPAAGLAPLRGKLGLDRDAPSELLLAFSLACPRAVLAYAECDGIVPKLPASAWIAAGARPPPEIILPGAGHAECIGHKPYAQALALAAKRACAGAGHGL